MRQNGDTSGHRFAGWFLISCGKRLTGHGGNKARTYICVPSSHHRPPVHWERDAIVAVVAHAKEALAVFYFAFIIIIFFLLVFFFVLLLHAEPRD